MLNNKRCEWTPLTTPKSIQRPKVVVVALEQPLIKPSKRSPCTTTTIRLMWTVMTGPLLRPCASLIWAQVEDLRACVGEGAEEDEGAHRALVPVSCRQDAKWRPAMETSLRDANQDARASS